jgi:hypothetical protein
MKEKQRHDEVTLPNVRNPNKDKMPLEEIMSRWYDRSPAHDDYSLIPTQGARNGEIPSGNGVTLLEDHSGRPKYNAASIADQTTKRQRGSTKHSAGNERGEGRDSKLNFVRYRKLLLESPAYRWLITSLRREALLISARTNLMESIREEIIRSLPTSSTMSRTQSAEVYMITYRVDWNPLAFFKEQGYKEDPGDVIEKAITLTGSTRDAQALVCARYLSQTWPFTGEHVMRLLQKMLRDEPGHPHTCKLLK